MGTEGQQAYRGHAGTCAGRIHASRSHTQLPSCLPSLFTCQVEISCHPPKSQDQAPEDQRFPKKRDKSPESPPPSPELSSAPSALGMPQQSHHAEASPSPHAFSVEAKTEQTLATSSFAVLPLSTVETLHWRGLVPATQSSPPLGAPGTSLMAGAASSLAAPWTGGSCIPLAGISSPSLIWGSTSVPVRALLPPQCFLCSSQPQSCLSSPNHSHSAVSKETSQAAEKRRDRRHSFPWGLALNLVP